MNIPEDYKNALFETENMKIWKGLLDAYADLAGRTQAILSNRDDPGKLSKERVEKCILCMAEGFKNDPHFIPVHAEAVPLGEDELSLCFDRALIFILARDMCKSIYGKLRALKERHKEVHKMIPVMSDRHIEFRWNQMDEYARFVNLEVAETSFGKGDAK